MYQNKENFNYYFQNDYTENDNEASTKRLYLDIFFLSLIIIANVIGILIILKRIKILKRQGTKEDNSSIIKDAELAVMLTFVATAAFAYESWKEYKRNPTNENIAFLLALILILVALFIRYIALRNSSYAVSVEDIVT